MSARTFQYQHRVTYSECTAGNHIYYSRYLDILEAARGEFFRHLGAPLLKLQQAEIIFPVIECHLRYHCPARYDDLLTVELWIETLQRVRLNFACRILNQNGVHILTGQTFHACTSLNEKPRRLPEDLARLLTPYVLPEKPN